MNLPQQLIENLEAAKSLPTGSDERFSGYGVMGLPFASGHILAMRRFPASSVGPGYTSVWHRNPDGDWMFYATVTPRQSCTRYFGVIASRTIKTDILIRWLKPFHFQVTMPALPFAWDIMVGETAATRLMNAAGRILPDSAWHNSGVLTTMGLIAGPFLRVGRIGLHGRVPNGQRFIVTPRVLWAVVDSSASLAGKDFGPPGPLQSQARLGDFWIPQRGMLAIGQAFFESFDPAYHSSCTSLSEFP